MKKYILSETQMQQIIDSMIFEYGLIDEQAEIPPDDNEFLNLLDDPEEEDDDEIFRPEPHVDEPEDEPVQQPKPKKKSITDILKEKWLEENPHLTDEVMESTIHFFNQKKNGLRPYKTPAEDPNYTNLPVVSALIARFPEMHDIVTDVQKLRDIQRYTWEQMEFFMDRFGFVDGGNTNVINFQIKGDTFERKLESALEIWNRTENLVYNQNNVRAFKITGTDEAIAFGRVQRITIEEYGGMGWCSSRIVNPAPGTPSEGANMYSTYRPYSSYYYVLNKNLPKSHSWFTFVINACDMNTTSGRQKGPYMITPRENGTMQNKTWDEVCSITGLNEFRDKENIFRYYPLTTKEKSSAYLDQINFRTTIGADGEEILHENHFRRQPFAIQKMYIEAGRPINDPESFAVLPWTTSKDEAEKAKDLRMLYIKNTNLDNWRERFLSNQDDPFGMINIIQKETPQHARFLDYLLMSELKISSGLMGIKIKILQTQYTAIFIDKEKKYVCLKSRTGTFKYGVLDLNTINWIKDLNEGYVRTTVIPTVKNDGKKYIFQRFTSGYGDDIFYFAFAFTDYYNPKSQTRGHGIYYNNDEFEELINNGEYRKLGFERK